MLNVSWFASFFWTRASSHKPAHISRLDFSFETMSWNSWFNSCHFMPQSPSFHAVKWRKWRCNLPEIARPIRRWMITNKLCYAALCTFIFAWKNCNWSDVDSILFLIFASSIGPMPIFCIAVCLKAGCNCVCLGGSKQSWRKITSHKADGNDAQNAKTFRG